MLDQLGLPCVFEQVIPGKLHADGRRYLPLLVMRPAGAAAAPGATLVTPPDLRLGVVDRHHRVDPGLAGQEGAARLVCALSTVQVQAPPYRQGWLPEPTAPGFASTEPTVLGQVRAVLTWEAERGHLPYESLYTELHLDVGGGLVGVRTSVTAADLAAALGQPRLEAGDWIVLTRSRIDILSFGAKH